MATQQQRSEDRLANIVLFAMFAVPVVAVLIITALTSDATVTTATWPAADGDTTTAAWATSGAASTAEVTPDGWLLVSPDTPGWVTTARTSERAARVTVRVAAEANAAEGDAAPQLPAVECFTAPDGSGGYVVAFSDDEVHVTGGRLDTTEPFAGATASTVEAVVSCERVPGGATAITVTGIAADVEPVRVEDTEVLPPGRAALRIEADSAVTLFNLEVTAHTR